MLYLVERTFWISVSIFDSQRLPKVNLKYYFEKFWIQFCLSLPHCVCTLFNQNTLRSHTILSHTSKYMTIKFSHNNSVNHILKLFHPNCQIGILIFILHTTSPSHLHFVRLKTFQHSQTFLSHSQYILHLLPFTFSILKVSFQ